MDFINGSDLFQMIKYGASMIRLKRKLLNDINVFPVPDGDTGTNLVHTMQTITRTSTSYESFHDTLESISNAALIGARGNSGVIFAQFINGVRIASEGKDQVSREDLAEMVSYSVIHTYDSLENPVEGTILTVLKTWSNALTNIKHESEDFKAFFLEAYTIAQKALDQTTDQLDVLKERNVVDSGAMGFILFLEGINKYFNHEELEVEAVEDVKIAHDHSHDKLGEYRFCTEGLVKAAIQNKDQIIQALKPYGDSLIVALGATFFRIHIHTNEPYNVFLKLKDFGEIVHQKVDDMALDIKMYQSHKDTVIVTDSIGDIDSSYLLDNDVFVLPINIIADQVNYFDKLTINNEILFDVIHRNEEYPTTATPTIGAVSDLFEKLLSNYKHMIVISVSSKLSATYQVVAEQIKVFQTEQHHIIHIDSMTNSAAQGLLVKRAVELLNEGKRLADIEKIINEDKKRTEILVCLETFKYATMSGRLPKAVGKIGMALGIRPIMSIDKQGKGAAFGFSLSQKGITKKIVKRIKKDLQQTGIRVYALVHCLNESLVHTYEALFTEIIGKKPEFIADVSSATAIHSGQGTVAIAYIKDWVN